MRNLVLSAFALATAISGGAAIAQPANPGLAQLAASVGVSADGFTAAQLIRLNDAQKEGDQTAIAFILSQRAGGVSRSDMGGATPGAAQFAANLGVAPGKYTVSELIQLDQAVKDGDAQAAAFITTGTNRAPAASSASAGAAQIAALLGVNAADYSLNELVALYHQQFGSDEG